MRQFPNNLHLDFSIPENLPSSLAIASTLTLDLIPLVGSQIILSTILAIQNNNHKQEHKIYMENPFSLKGKTKRQTPNNFTIYQINYNNSFVYLTAKEKSLFFFFFCSHTHSLCVSKAATLYSVLFNNLIEGGNSLLSPLWLSHRRRQDFALSFLLHSSQAKILFFSLLVSSCIFPLPI